MEENENKTQKPKMKAFMKVGADAIKNQSFNLLVNIPMSITAWMATNNMPIKDTLSVVTSIALGSVQYLHDERKSVNKEVTLASDAKMVAKKIADVTKVNKVVENIRTKIKPSRSGPKVY